MPDAFTRPVRAAAAIAAVLLLCLPALAQTLFHQAENQVQVALVKVVRAAGYTEVHLQTLKAMAGICWYASGVNSPYLLADGRRFRYLDGGNITACPGKQAYANQEVMVLRFEPLPANARAFALVEGQGGENQMVDPKSSREQFWNFLRVKLD
jgi:hypothetical protein